MFHLFLHLCGKKHQEAVSLTEISQCNFSVFLFSSCAQFLFLKMIQVITESPSLTV